MTSNYKFAFVMALGLHCLLIVMFMMEPNHSQYVLKSENDSTTVTSVNTEPNQAIKAVSVDSQEVNKTIERIQAERAKQKLAELNHQRKLKEQAQQAKSARLREQQQLMQLKKEAALLAKQQQQKLAEEQQHLKDLAALKLKQEQHIAEMKQQEQQLKQQQETEQKALADMKAAKAKQQLQMEQAQAAEKMKAQQAAAASQAAQARAMAGEVDKYKAMIIQAISQQWILPESANSSLSSQFRIRLAPTGEVLDVNLTRSSGDSILDRSAQAAIYKASPLPVPKEKIMFDMFRDISLTVRPANARG